MKYKYVLLLSFMSFMGACPLVRAQYSLPLDITSTGVGFGMDTNGAFYVQGGSGALVSGQGPQPNVPGILWYPNKAAFFEGFQGDHYLGDDTMGYDSAALGGGKAYGDCSLAGPVATATGNTSAAFCNGYASTWTSFSVGAASFATGYTAVALGYFSNAGGDYSLALGTGATAPGYNCAAIGTGSLAQGAWCFAGPGATTGGGTNYAVALGQGTRSGGNNTTAFGAYTNVGSYLSFALGTYNLGGGASWNTWVPTDPLFEIGNGTDSSHLSDALVVYKNGNAILQGSLQVAPTGDIPMYDPSN